MRDDRWNKKTTTTMGPQYGAKSSNKKPEMRKRERGNRGGQGFWGTLSILSERYVRVRGAGKRKFTKHWFYLEETKKGKKKGGKEAR